MRCHVQARVRVWPFTYEQIDSHDNREVDEISRTVASLAAARRTVVKFLDGIDFLPPREVSLEEIQDGRGRCVCVFRSSESCSANNSTGRRSISLVDRAVPWKRQFGHILTVAEVQEKTSHRKAADSFHCTEGSTLDVLEISACSCGLNISSSRPEL